MSHRPVENIHGEELNACNERVFHNWREQEVFTATAFVQDHNEDTNDNPYSEEHS